MEKQNQIKATPIAIAEKIVSLGQDMRYRAMLEGKNGVMLENLIRKAISKFETNKWTAELLCLGLSSFESIAEPAVVTLEGLEAKKELEIIREKGYGRITDKATKAVERIECSETIREIEKTLLQI